ncbi:hypothetical protein GE253_05090 [Niveispirillum sp. SYP-B3756]|uniref:HI1506-related protein n=1 Tax=Niveispirillum sp. SYP-B3756 TaxID=2662178 RepID=UPI001291BFEC|nr:HI1506-related protein [Niveispirillum sp. SYP-B3756]MQP64718.1 hypothetical protein [Niveispirillum sp. SYP-B3756]
MKIKITAPSDGYVRAGLRHTKGGRIHDAADLTEAQQLTLAADPHLRIVPVNDEVSEQQLPAETVQRRRKGG